MKRYIFLLVFLVLLLAACTNQNDSHKISMVHDYIKNKLDNPNLAKFTDDDRITHHAENNTWTDTGTVRDVGADGHPLYKYNVTVDKDDKLISMND